MGRIRCKWKWAGVGYPQSLSEKREAQHEWRQLARCGASTMNGGDSRSCAAMSKSYSRGVGAWSCSRTKSPESGGCKNLNGVGGGGGDSRGHTVRPHRTVQYHSPHPTI